MRRLASLLTALCLTSGAVAFGATFEASPSAATSAAASTCASDAAPSISVVNDQIALGGVLRFSGAGWCHPVDGGSRIGVKIDQGAYSRLDTTVHANKSIWAIVDASATDGTFSAELALPDGTDATSTPAFGLGPHTLQLLTGSLKPGDTVRSQASEEFTVVAGDTSTPAEPDWPHTTVSAGEASAWLQKSVGAGDGQTLRIAGQGWTHLTGGVSAIAVKLNRSAEGDQYARSGAQVLEGDPTLWALIRPVDGAFDTTLDLPPGLTAGQYLTVSLATGKFAAGDTQRSVTTKPIVVGDVAWTGSAGEAKPPCRPTSTTPTVELDGARGAFGATLHLRGAGWCNPAGGGSRISVKIDDGAYSRLDAALHANRTIWAIIEAADDGTFDAKVQLPDGTKKTSTPVLTRGEHRLRLLSGTLAPGDTVRTVESAPFVVGRYRPNGTPDPLDVARDLRRGQRHGASASMRGKHLRVHLPQSAVGTWAFVSVYAPDGSPRYPWTRWWRLGAGHRLTLPLRTGELEGPGRVVVQSGEPGHVGEVLGWTRTRFGSGPDAPAPATPGSPPAQVPMPPVLPALPTPSGAGTLPYVSSGAPTTARTPAQLTRPDRPFAGFGDLDPAAHGSVSSALDDAILTVTVRKAKPGTKVFVRVYSADQVKSVGWATLDRRHRLRLGLGAFGTAYLGVTLQNTDGRLLGWTPVALGLSEETGDSAAGSAGDAARSAPPEQVITIPAAAPTWITPTDGLLLTAGALLLAVASLITSRPRRAVRS